MNQLTAEKQLAASVTELKAKSEFWAYVCQTVRQRTEDKYGATCWIYMQKLIFTMPVRLSRCNILNLVYAPLKQATCLTAGFSYVNRD